ncbi:MAG: hypothetical protein ACR5LH_02195, partial [Sodalis sp. (in: enterobacteria)]
MSINTTQSLCRLINAFWDFLALLNKSELADRMALYYTCYPILTLCGIPNNVIRFSALTIA